MYLEVFLVGLLGAISPGPDFFVVMKNSLAYGSRIGYATALGISTALTIHISYTILGFALIMQKNPMVFTLIQLAGAGYLIKLGLQSIFSKSTTQSKEEPLFDPAASAEASADVINDFSPNQSRIKESTGIAKKSITKGFKEGFFCNMLNPRAALFFLSIFSQFLSAETPYWVHWFYGLEVIIAVGGWFILLAALISSSYFRLIYEKYRHWFDRILGGSLLYFAFRIIFSVFGLN